MKGTLSRVVLMLSLWLLGGEARCGERLERALDMMQRGASSSRRRYDHEDADMVYQQRLRSAPIHVSITRIMVEIPPGGSRDGAGWARVEQCQYEPSNNSVRTRLSFSELQVSGLVRLVGSSEPERAEDEPDEPLESRGLLQPAEQCRVSLRMRRAGMDFYTSPISRGRGQMRIRTESSFLEPRFASIYAYGCRPAFFTPAGYDRVESEPRSRREPPSPRLTNADSNLVTNSSAYEEELSEEENRIPEWRPERGPGSDALLDSLWRSRGDIAREMEDVFLRSASQAITHYIERQLHPAIKETLMLSMGYTVSYG